MKILITGATGFVGKALTQKLKEAGHDIYCLIRKTSVIAELESLGVNFIYGDLTDIDSLYPAVAGKDYIYHLAIARFPRTINAYYAVNSYGTKNLIQACHERNPSLKKIVYLSSLAAAGFCVHDSPLKETDTEHPITHYGKSKLKGEKAVLAYKDRLPIVILRPPTIVGSGNLFLTYIASWIKHGIKLHWDGYTSLCSLDDLIHGMISAAENHKSESQIYYICDGRSYSWAEITNAIASYSPQRKIEISVPRLCLYPAIPLLSGLGKLIHKPYLTNKAIELVHRYWLCDPSKIHKELGFQCKYDLKTTLDIWHTEANPFQKPKICYK